MYKLKIKLFLKFRICFYLFVRLKFDQCVVGDYAYINPDINRSNKYGESVDSILAYFFFYLFKFQIGIESLIRY